MHYESITPVSRADAELAAAAAAPGELLSALVAVALHDSDPDWASGFCARLAGHSDPGVRGCALLGFGHLARRFGALDESRARSLLAAGLCDPDPWVPGQAGDAASDAEFFAGWAPVSGGVAGT